MNAQRCSTDKWFFLMSGMLLAVALLWTGCDNADTNLDELFGGPDTNSETTKSNSDNIVDSSDDSDDSRLSSDDMETETIADIETETVGDVETETVGTSGNESDTTWLENGYGRLLPYNDVVGVSINYGASFTTTVSRDVKCVTRETLIAFMETNAGLFTSEQYEQITGHYSYTGPGYVAELLLGMLGVQLANDFNWFFDKNDIDISPATPQSETFVNALNNLVEKEYRMSGPVTSVGLSAMPVNPVYYVRVAKLNFANGVTVRAINTHVYVADENGSQSRVEGKAGEAPLTLTALQ